MIKPGGGAKTVMTVFLQDSSAGFSLYVWWSADEWGVITIFRQKIFFFFFPENVDSLSINTSCDQKKKRLKQV